MKRTLLLIVNTLATLAMLAQASSNPDHATQMDYRPFIEDGKVWKVGAANSGNPVQWVEYYFFDGDTIIDGKSCKQMMCQRYASPDYPEYDAISQQPSPSYVGAWYEAERKVYLYNSANEHFLMMYDFSLDAYDTLQINHQRYVIGPRESGGIQGFKGFYREVEDNMSHKTTWMESVGGFYGPTINIIDGAMTDTAPLLMSCTIDGEVIYHNHEYEDGATPEITNASKQRIDFNHTTKKRPKAPLWRSASQSLYGEYNDKQLSIDLDAIDDAYQVRITGETGKSFYEKAINAGTIVGLNIDISAYPKGHYTVDIENSQESFTGQFDTQTTGIAEVKSKKTEAKDAIYTLQGQRIISLQKGVNIVNGRKVFAK